MTKQTSLGLDRTPQASNGPKHDGGTLALINDAPVIRTDRSQYCMYFKDVL